MAETITLADGTVLKRTTYRTIHDFETNKILRFYKYEDGKGRKHELCKHITMEEYLIEKQKEREENRKKPDHHLDIFNHLD
jgi:hypothetical protein